LIEKGVVEGRGEERKSGGGRGREGEREGRHMLV